MIHEASIPERLASIAPSLALTIILGHTVSGKSQETGYKTYCIYSSSCHLVVIVEVVKTIAELCLVACGDPRAGEHSEGSSVLRGKLSEGSLGAILK